MKDLIVNELYKTPFVLGESPIWDERTQQLYFVDILDRKLYIYDVKHKSLIKHNFKEYISCVALCESPEKLVVALESGIYYYTIANRSLDFIVQPEVKPNYRYNDGSVDSKGNWLLGSMNNINNGSEATHLPDASLYLIKGTDYNVLLDNVTISNGIVFYDNHLFYIDSIKNNVRRFLYKNDILENETEIITFKNEGTPDGMALSKSGKLYIAMWGGSKIVIFDLKIQKVIGAIQLPFPNPTSCTFGGEEMNELFITSAGLGDPEIPSGLYSVKLEDIGGFENKINWN